MKVNESKAAKYLGIPMWTLKYARQNNKPLVRYLSIEGRAWYEKGDLDEYLNGQTVEPQGKVADV